MRELPGRAARSSLGEPPTELTRESVEEAQRLRIMRATGELIAKRGYGDVTVDLIRKRARVSFKTFYKHFSNKDEAFLALFDLGYEIAEQRILQAIAAQPEESWPRQVAAALRAFFELVAEEPIIARACIVEAPAAGPIVFDRYERASKAFAPLFRRGREQSHTGDQLPETLEDTLAGSVVWSAYQRLITSEVSRIEALLPEVIELVLRPYVGEREAAQIARDAIGEAEPV